MYDRLVRECHLINEEETMRRSDVRLNNLAEGISTTAGQRAVAIMSLICTTPERAFTSANHILLNILTEHEFFWMMDSVDLITNVIRVMLTEPWYPVIDVRPHDGHYEILFKPFGRFGPASYIHLTLRDYGIKTFDERLYILIGSHAANDYLSSPTSRNCVFLTTPKDNNQAQRLYQFHKEAFTFAFVSSLINKQQDFDRRVILRDSICTILDSIDENNSISDFLRGININNFSVGAIEVFKCLEEKAISKGSMKRT